ncbi:MAG: hypothetical protein LKE81_00065 [Acetobacter sp.]|nr:hypothetical protein [Acetobacter sp.]
MPTERHAFSALKLTDISPWPGLWRASLVAGKALPYPEPPAAARRGLTTPR